MLGVSSAMERDPSSDDSTLSELAASIAKTPLATIVTDNRQPDNPIVAVNAAFMALTGYREGEIIGRNCRFLGGPATEPEARAAMREAVAHSEPVVVELTNYRADGTAFRNAVMIAPVRDETGRAAFFVGSQMDVSQAGPAGLRQTRAQKLLQRLSKRQRQVLKLMTAGYRNKQIGGELGIDEKTVKMHRARLIKALGVKGSADAIRISVESNLSLNDPA